MTGAATSNTTICLECRRIIRGSISVNIPLSTLFYINTVQCYGPMCLGLIQQRHLRPLMVIKLYENREDSAGVATGTRSFLLVCFVFQL